MDIVDKLYSVHIIEYYITVKKNVLHHQVSIQMTHRCEAEKSKLLNTWSIITYSKQSRSKLYCLGIPASVIQL